MKNLKFALTILTALSINFSLPSLVLADSYNNPPEEQNLLLEIQSHCQINQCSSPYVLMSLDKKTLSTDMIQQFQVIAEDQVQVWGDTILEGDYYSDGDVIIEEIAAIFKSHQLVGYRIVYSQKAWMTANCEYNPDKVDTLNACSKGRIKEASFVSISYKTYFTDQNNFAEFGE